MRTDSRIYAPHSIVLFLLLRTSPFDVRLESHGSCVLARALRPSPHNTVAWSVQSLHETEWDIFEVVTAFFGVAFVLSICLLLVSLVVAIGS